MGSDPIHDNLFLHYVSQTITVIYNASPEKPNSIPEKSVYDVSGYKYCAHIGELMISTEF